MENRVITCVETVLAANDDYEAFMALAHLEELQFVVSNTTDAGTAAEEDDEAEEDDGVDYNLRYRCPNCGHKWEDVHSCAVDSDCPNCLTRNISPLQVKSIFQPWDDEENKVWEKAGWKIGTKKKGGKK